VIAAATAATLVCFGAVALWSPRSRSATVSPSAIVVEAAAARVVGHPGDGLLASPATFPQQAADVVPPAGWPDGMLSPHFLVRSTGAIGELLVVTGTLPRDEVEPWTSSLVGIWAVTSRVNARNDAGTLVTRMSLRGGGMISVQDGDPAVVEVILTR
jgi:hypothetical protein